MIVRPVMINVHVSARQSQAKWLDGWKADIVSEDNSIPFTNTHTAWMSEMVKQLERTEQATPDQHLQNQQKRLREIVAHASATTPAYKTRLAPLVRSDGEISLDGWQDIPVMTRKEAVAFGDQLVSTRVPQSHGEIGPNQTSGSSGRPYIFVVNQLHYNMVWAVMARFHRWHNIDYGNSFASIFPFVAGKATWPSGIEKQSWCPEALMPDQPGEYFALNINTPIEQQIEWLRRVRPDYLHSFASNIRAIALANTDQSEPLVFKNIFSFGESLNEDTKDIVEKTWGSRPLDCYSAAECGLMAIQSPVSEQYLVQPEVVFLEILNDQHRQCQPNEIGHVVVTPLHNYAQPLIRYDTGDLASFGDHDASGLPFPVLNKIQGRVRNVFHFPNGRSIQPAIASRRILHFLNAEEWQVAQTAPTKLEIRIVPKSDSLEMDTAGMTQHVEKLFGLSLSINYKIMSKLQNPRTGKREDYVCELSEPKI